MLFLSISQLGINLIRQHVNVFLDDDLGDFLQILLSHNRAGGIVRGVDDDGLGVLVDEALERGHVYLEAGGVRGDHDELVARGLDEGLILGEEGGDGDDLAVLAGEGGERGHERGGGAAGEEEVGGADDLAEALREVLRDGLADAVVARAAGVAVDLYAALGVEDVDYGLVDLLGRGDGGVAEAVIEDVLLAHDLGLLAAVLEHLAYVGANAAQSVCRFVKHAVCLL